MLSPTDPRHGTENAYNHFRCRCAICTQAHKKYMHDYRCKVAGKKFLESQRDNLVFLAENMPHLGSTQGCWIYDLSNTAIKRRDVREIMYTLQTGLIPPRLMTTKYYAPGYFCMPCDPRCIRPEHIKVISDVTPLEEIFDLAPSQLEVMTALSYMPARSCWFIPRNEFSVDEIFTMRKAFSENSRMLKTVGSCSAPNCMNPEHFSYRATEDTAPPLANSQVIRFKKPESNEEVNATAESPDTEPTVDVQEPATIAVAVGSPSLRRSLYTPVPKKEMRPKEVQRRIYEFKRRIEKDLNAYVDYAACLTNKIVYNSSEDAKAAEEIWTSLSLHLAIPARSYKCHKCRFWHLTTKENWSALDSRPEVTLLS